MSETFSIFNRRGIVDLTGLDEQIAALSSGRKAALDVLIAASTKNQESESALKEAEIAVKTAIANVANAQRDLLRACPAPTFHDIWLASVGKAPPKAPESDEAKAAKATARAADESLALMRDNLVSAKEIAKVMRARFAEALSNWTNDGRLVPTRESLVREMSKRDRERKLAVIRGEIVEPPPVRVNGSVVDQHAKATEGSAPQRHPQSAPGPGYRRGAFPQSMRGRRLRG
jgi:hypothetical protein